VIRNANRASIFDIGESGWHCERHKKSREIALTARALD
jgi:hypothetical protein